MSVLLHKCNACSDVHATSMPSAGSTYAADAGNGIFTICCGDFLAGTTGLFEGTNTSTENLIKTFMGFGGGVITGNHDAGQHVTMASDRWKEVTGLDLCTEKIVNGVHYIFISGNKSGGAQGTVWDDGKPIYTEEVRTQALTWIQAAKDAGERCIILTHYPLEQGTTDGNGFGFRVGQPRGTGTAYRPTVYTSSGYLAKDSSGKAYDTDFYNAIAAFDNVLWLSGHTHVNWRYQSGYDDGTNIDSEGNPIAYPNQKAYKVPGGAVMINLPSLQFQGQDARIEVYDDRVIVRARENAAELGGEYNYTWYISDGSLVKNAPEPTIGMSHPITSSLTNCAATASNPSSIEESSTATLQFTANSGYTLPAAISVIGASYTWDPTTGTLVLSNPTGNVSITITANIITYPITATLSHCAASTSNPTTISANGAASLQFNANIGYSLPSTVTVSGATYNWNAATGTLTLSNPTSNVSISIAATKITYSIQTTLRGCTGSSGNVTSIEYGGTVELTFIADSGYTLPDTVTVSGATSSWDKTTGKLTLSNPTANILITIAATEEVPGSNIPVYSLAGVRILSINEVWNYSGGHPAKLYTKSGVEIIFGDAPQVSLLDNGRLNTFILA